MNLRPIGKIARLQIQRSTLSLGEKPNRYFDPAALLAVDELTITSRGALARLPGGETLLDYHHADYPNGANYDDNDLSVNFTSHYAAIRERFGEAPHLYDGCGGENILVETAGRVSPEAASGGVAVRTREGRLVWLRQVTVAHPCQPFSKYVSRRTEPESIKATLQFLDDGTRGFYCVFEDEGEAVIAVGDEVLVADGRPGPIPL